MRTGAGLALALGAALGGSLAASATTQHASGSHAAHGAPGSGPGGAAPAAAGTVESVDTSASSFTLKEANGDSVTVDVTSSTTYRDPSVSSPSLSDVTTGKRVAVLGTSSSGTVTATTVLIGIPTGPGGAGGPGGGGPHGPDGSGWPVGNAPAGSTGSSGAA